MAGAQETRPLQALLFSPLHAFYYNIHEEQRFLRQLNFYSTRGHAVFYGRNVEWDDTANSKKPFFLRCVERALGWLLESYGIWGGRAFAS